MRYQERGHEQKLAQRARRWILLTARTNWRSCGTTLHQEFLWKTCANGAKKRALLTTDPVAKRLAWAEITVDDCEGVIVSDECAVEKVKGRTYRLGLCKHCRKYHKDCTTGVTRGPEVYGLVLHMET